MKQKLILYSAVLAVLFSIIGCRVPLTSKVRHLKLANIMNLRVERACRRIQRRPVSGYTWHTLNPKIAGVALIHEIYRLSTVITRISPDHGIQ
jgi:hypothetical protein